MNENQLCAGIPSNTDFIVPFNGKYEQDFGGPLICIDPTTKQPIFTGVTSANSLSTKKSVITASIKELRKMNTSKDKLLIWEEYLQNAISDMNKGEKAALYWQPGKQITFYVEGGSKELIKDKEFADAYINIWIGKNTTKPDLRKIITGQH